jgi:methionyl aminopeptidase
MSWRDKEAFEKFRLSGKILRETREEMKGFVQEDMPIIEVCEKAETLIKKKGAKPAFPCNVSINEIAAHYTSPPGDKSRIPKNTLVKVDIGAHVDGYVTDTAFTACFAPEHRGLVETAERALAAAIETIQPEISTSKIGRVIESAIKSRGFKPVSNLTGHQISRYVLHTGTSVPNVPQLFSSKIKIGGVYAIEPFVTLPNAVGKVENGEQTTIFRLVKSRSVKNEYAKKLLKHIEGSFRTLPFAERWLEGVVPKEHHEQAFRELLSSKSLMGYPIFVEVSRKTVAQAEHTVLVVEDGCVVLT